MAEQPTIGITIRLTPAERDALRAAAAREERPIQWVVRRLIRNYIAAELGARREP